MGCKDPIISTYSLTFWTNIESRVSEQRGAMIAIVLKYYEDLDAEEVARQLKTTKAYVYQLLSHHYAELRRISIDQFGISGTDL